ncbi:MAG: hypothetical protein QM784_11275 [Polyangiaceae bacterium]
MALLSIGWAGTSGLRYVESDRFCGTQCHRAMAPQFVSHAASVHSAVPCVSCHGGFGVFGRFSAKLSGLRHVWVNFVGSRRPIRVSASQSEAISDACRGCHAPPRSSVEKRDVVRFHRAIDSHLPSRTLGLTLRMAPSGAEVGQSGIGWHMDSSSRIRYVEDESGRVPWIEYEAPSGEKTVYVGMDTSHSLAELDAMPRRNFGCTGCHNRVAHDFTRRVGDVVTTTPQNKTASIDFDPSRYPSHLGHRASLGCFRCHDGRHRAADGTLLSSDCALTCHDQPHVLTESPPVAPIGRALHIGTWVNYRKACPRSRRTRACFAATVMVGRSHQNVLVSNAIIRSIESAAFGNSQTGFRGRRIVEESSNDHRYLRSFAIVRMRLGSGNAHSAALGTHY